MVSSERLTGYNSFKSIVKTICKARLIEVSLGRDAKGVQSEGMTTNTFHPSLATRFKPTMVLIAMGEEATIIEEGSRKHFLQQRPVNVIEARAKSTSARGIKSRVENSCSLTLGPVFR